MKIGIIGTRGIPNQYGGFEQFAEFVAPALVSRGHDVTVYNSSLHPYKEKNYKGVRIVSRRDPENKLGTFGQFIYDFNCIWHARSQQYDVILQLGYTSSSIWSFLFPKKTAVVTNMDGLEWKRAKYSKPVQRFLQSAEKWAATYSDALIADSKGIQAYLQKKYSKSSAFIAYGATPVHDFSASYLRKLELTPYAYDLVIARMEPENNIEPIIRGHQAAKGTNRLIIIGSYNNQYGQYLKKTYENEQTRFVGAMYDMELLNSLRYFSRFYFHGHSVGGTNPSLLEAMASQALIVAHDNIFNRSVLEEDAFYFDTEKNITQLLEGEVTNERYSSYKTNNLNKIKGSYSWDHITTLLEDYLATVLKG